MSQKIRPVPVKKLVLLVFFYGLCCWKFAEAAENEKIFSWQSRQLNLNKGEPKISAETFAKTQEILRYYQVPEELDPSPAHWAFEEIQSLSAFKNLLKFFDPTGFFQRLSNFSGHHFSVYQDIDRKSIHDFSFDFQIRSKIKPQRSLDGLRIAIDPGHMGGDFWDRTTGKYVEDSKGRVLSEGILNLQTALLLKKELERLGATVLLTREQVAPVSAENFSTFDLLPYARSELRESIHTDWFLKLIKKAVAGDDLVSLFQADASRKQMFSEASRSNYFILRSDLWARVDKIAHFQPDLVLVIHFDILPLDLNEFALNPKAPRETKAYVVGGYQPMEMGSRVSREEFVRHMLDKTSWDQSLLLSRKIVQRFQKNMDFDKATWGGDSATMIEPGIFSRNLMIPRKLFGAAVSYLECFFYNNPKEFELLYAQDRDLYIDGVNHPYSKRLEETVMAIRDGVVDYSAEK